MLLGVRTKRSGGEESPDPGSRQITLNPNPFHYPFTFPRHLHDQLVGPQSLHPMTKLWCYIGGERNIFGVTISPDRTIDFNLLLQVINT